MECKVGQLFAALTGQGSFNRNIVECKVTDAEAALLDAARFNRNIVECKGYLVGQKMQQAVVLIETLWNVK